MGIDDAKGSEAKNLDEPAIVEKADTDPSLLSYFSDGIKENQSELQH